MPLIDNTCSYTQLIPTSSLPASRPYGIAASNDGSKLYVSCVGSSPSAGSGRLVEIDIATATATTLASGYNHMKHGVSVDDDGNVYFSAGTNGVGGSSFPVYVWDGSSVSTWVTTVNPYGLHVADDEGYLWVYEDTRVKRRPLTSPGTVQTMTGGSVGFRGIGISPGYVVITDADTQRVYIHNRATTVNSVLATLGGVNAGIYGYSDTEFYMVQRTNLLRVDPTVPSYTTLTPGSDPGPTKSDIVVTSQGRCFVVVGGYSPDSGSGNPQDIAVPSDLGIYELSTNFVLAGQPSLGFIGH